MKKIKSKLGVGASVLSRYKDLNYRAWYAVAEFVDNSLHAYYENKKVLDKQLKKENEKLRIDISYERENDSLRVVDNSMGMDMDDIQDLVTVGRTKKKAVLQLSQFGMGMKTAGFWMGGQIEIQTQKLGSTKEYSFVLNLNDIISGKEIEIEEKTSKNSEQHYTIINITKHHQQFVGRTVSKISETLGSLYRKFIEDEVDIYYNGLKLKHKEYKLAKNIRGQEYKMDFKVEGKFTSTELINEHGKTFEVTGWLGILDKGRLSHAGFSVFRYKRMIQGAPDFGWKMTELWGGDNDMGTNNLRNQTLIGELYCDKLPVTHTKDKISFGGVDEIHFRLEMEKLLKNFAMQAEDTKTNIRGGSQTSPNVINRVVGKLTPSRLNDLVNQISLETDNTKGIISSNKTVVQAAQNSSKPVIETSVMIIGQKWKIQYYENPKSSANDPYVTRDVDPENNTIIIVVNPNHPIVSNYDTTSSREQYIEMCIFDGLSEHIVTQFNKVEFDTFRKTKDSLLRSNTSIL